ncbi:TPA: hypothetical protein G8V85_004402 [Salmonella enterica]|nr:hypothetical protein [Salmonella enterica]
MSKWNIASFSKEDQDKVSVDKAAAAVAWQERMNKPVVPELVEREQPEHLLPGGTKQQVPANVKTAAPETQRMTGFKSKTTD